MTIKTKLFFLILLIGIFSPYGRAQVTIGSEKSPMQGALLQLKENEGTGVNSTKGLLLPRVLLNTATDFDVVLSGATAAQKAEHTGLTVYHIGNQYLCAGVYVWSNTQWARLPKTCEVKFNCASAQLNGTYAIGTALTSANTITINIEAPRASAGGTYRIYTDTKNGMSFSGTGTLTEGTQSVILRGTGTPKSGGMATTFTIYAEYSNSLPNPATCSVSMDANRIAIARSDIFGFGLYNNVAGYYAGMASTGSRLFITSGNNFGTTTGTSTVNSSGFTFNTTPVAVDAIDVSNFINSVGWKSNPGIIINGFYSSTTSTVVIDSLVAYVKRGGVLILFDEYGNGVNYTNHITRQICQKLFPTSTISIVAGGTLGATSTITTSVDDEITNGSFGDVRGKMWGHDASTSVALKGLPVDSISVYSTGSYVNTSNASGGDDTAVSMFKHKRLNLFFCGDGGFLANPAGGTGSYPSLATATAYPFAIDANNRPIGRTSWGYNSSRTVYNSQIFANILAWAARRSKSNNK